MRASYDYTSVIRISEFIHNGKGDEYKYHHNEGYRRTYVQGTRNELTLDRVTDKLKRTAAELL